MNIAVIGGGVAGVGSAWLLSPEHHVDVYEAAPELGGHAKTVDLTVDGATFPADSGFQVFNTRTYPNLIRFFDRLGIEWIETDMSFSVQVGSEHIEWSGTNLNTVFAQRRNIANPRFLAMLAGIIKFSHDAERLLHDPEIDDITLAQEMLDVSDNLGRYVDPLEQGSLELGQHDFAGDQVVFYKNVA